MRYVDPNGEDWHVCVTDGKGGQICGNLSDGAYQALVAQQNGKQGIALPDSTVAGGPQDIICGGTVCGSAEHYENGLENASASIGVGIVAGGVISKAVGGVFGWVAGLFAKTAAETGGTVASRILLTGFSDAQKAMIQKSLTALEAAGYNTGRIKEMILMTDRPPTYFEGALSNLRGGADTITLAPGAFSSEQFLTHTVEEEVRHLRQNVQQIGVGEAVELEKAVGVDRKFPEPPHE